MFYGCYRDVLMFLAAISSSRSDNVTNSVCLSVVFFYYEHSKHLKQDVSGVYKGCSKGVLKMF